jgi:radical SAM protein with 4Fe4S-binding SPASM domain
MSAPLGDLAMPYHLVWGLTNACNVRCAHCYASSARPDPDELTADEAVTLLDALARWGVFDVAFSGGEVLLRRDTVALVARAAEHGLTTGLGTNGWLVTPATARRLADAGLSRLQVSVDGLAATHDQLRRRPGLFDRAVQAVANARSAGLPTNVCFTVHRRNVEELEDVVALCLSWGVTSFNLSQFVPTGRGDDDLDLPREQWRRVYRRWAELRAQHAGRMAFTSHLAQIALVDPGLAEQPGFTGCQAGMGQASIGPTGDVQPCVLLPVVVGNVRRTPLPVLWRDSPLIRALRDRSRLGEPCRSCALVSRCGGCRALALAVTGDPLAADPRCWKDCPTVTDPHRPEEVAR